MTAAIPFELASPLPTSILQPPTSALQVSLCALFFSLGALLQPRFVCFQHFPHSFLKSGGSFFLLRLFCALGAFVFNKFYLHCKKANDFQGAVGGQPTKKPIEADSSPAQAGRPAWGRRRVRNDTCGFLGSLIDRCQDYLGLAWRWRRASKRTTPAATETFRDFTGPRVGSETTKSQRLRVSSWRPWPSPPKTMPTGEV